MLIHGLIQLSMLTHAWGWLGPAGLHGAEAEWAVVGRGLAVTVAAGLLGFCLATLFGSTVAPLATLLGVAVVQWMAGIVMLLSGSAPWLLQLMPDSNLSAFVSGHFETTYLQRMPSGDEVERLLEIGAGQAALYLGTLLVIAVACGLWSFTRREIR